jgi:dTDP-glucose pyrophosphorylase
VTQPSQRFLLARVHVSKVISDVMWALERSRAEIALVVDEGDKLVGTMTDGDVRRALLKGATLDSPLSPHMTTRFTAVAPDVTRAAVLDLMQARTLGQIPIVDDTGKLVGLHRLHEVLGGTERTNPVVIMAGGRGSRLLPITEAVPKPMIKVAGRPILEHIILHLVGAGLRTFYVSINYLGHLIEEHFGNGERFGCHIEYLRETEPLGTGGALTLLATRPIEPVLVMNGDLVTQANVGAMLDYHAQGGHAVTIGVKQFFHTVPYGCVELDGDRVIAFHEKPTLMRWVNAGIYVLAPEQLDDLPAHAFTMPWLVERSMAQGQRVAAYEVADDWIDVGQRDQLTRAREGR